MNTPRPDVSLIVVSLNSKAYLRGCLDSIYAATWRNVTYEVVVTDNGSTDGTLEMLRDEYPQIGVLAQGRNLGFCPASNLGAVASQARYFMFLNDDIIVLEDAIAKLVEWMDEHPRAGSIGSRLLNIDGTDQFSSGRTWPTPMNALFARKSRLTKLFPNSKWSKRYLILDKCNTTEVYEVDWLSAAALLVRREAFYVAEKFDETYYYFHELVFCERVQRAGYTNHLHPQSKIIHYEGAGSGLRTLRVRSKHIIAFHKGAYRWYCGFRRLGAYHPLRVPIAAMLAGRGAFLICGEYVKTLTHRSPRLREKRPEGGVAL
jgi:N-acetylglucosaminyl-diphospho-decaprenol L-rhamnosyltransferase